MELKIFTQPTCPACPPAKKLGESLKDKIKVDFFDVSLPEGLAEAAQYDVMTTPTIVLLNDEKVVKAWLDTPNEDEVIKLIK